MNKLIKALKAAGEPTRLRILAALSQHELTVTELVRLLGQSQPRVSRHLKLLLEAGLLSRYQEGAWVFQRIDESSQAAHISQNVIDLIDFQHSVIQQDTARLAAIKADNAKLATDYFAQHAGDWDKIRTMIGSDSAIEAAMLNALDDRRFDTLIDMGTGTGRIVEIFAEHCNKATGFDSSQEMLKLARSHFEQAGLSHCQARLGDITALPATTKSADLITIHQVLHYLDRPIAVIQEAQRLLNKGGLMMIVDFAPHQHEFLRSEHAHRRLGFANSEVQFWCDNNELTLLSKQAITRNKQQNSLNVMLWLITKK